MKSSARLMWMAVLAAIAVPVFGQAGHWPARPISLIVPQAPGGGTDALGRLWAEYVGRSLNQAVVVENKPGANGVLASSHLAKQPADGYTVMVGGISSLAFNPFTYKSLPYNPQKDFDGIALLVNTPFLLMASPQSGIKSLADLVQQAKARPARLSFSSAGKGNSSHLMMEMVRDRLGIDLLHVPYNGGARALLAVMAAEVDLSIDVLFTSAAQAKNGKVVALAVIGAQRSPALASVPTMAEAGLKDLPQPGWYAMVAPAGTPPAIVQRLNAETQKFLSDPAVRAKLDSMQLEPLHGPAALVKEWMARDARLWEPVFTKLAISND